MKNSVFWQKRSKRSLQMYHLVLLTNWSSSKGFSTFWSFLFSSLTSSSARLSSFSNHSITLSLELSASWHHLCPWCSSMAFCRLADNRGSSQMRSYWDDSSSIKKMRRLSTRCCWSYRSYRKISPIFKNKVAATRLEAKGSKVSDLILHLWPLSWIRLDSSRVTRGTCRRGPLRNRRRWSQRSLSCTKPSNINNKHRRRSSNNLKVSWPTCPTSHRSLLQSHLSRRLSQMVNCHRPKPSTAESHHHQCHLSHQSLNLQSPTHKLLELPKQRSSRMEPPRPMAEKMRKRSIMMKRMKMVNTEKHY